MIPPSHDIDIPACRHRQLRLLTEMRLRGIELAVVTQIEHVQWLAGVRFRAVFAPAAALSADGRLTLVAPGKFEGSAAADDLVEYEAQWLSTLRNDQRQASSQALLAALPTPRPERIGVEFSSCGMHLSQQIGGELIDIEPDLYRLRRRKDADELARIRNAIAATGAMYAKARQIVRPGINELDVFNELQSVAVRELGEMATGTGNDYACGERGGPPRNRTAPAGELYILDLGPAFRGYFSDNCRTLSVDGHPTSSQTAAHAHVAGVFPIIERMVKPGVRCRDVNAAVQEYLNTASVGVFDHHLGHGIGLHPHEAPHLNPNWDDVFQEGEVFTAEPGLYAPELRAGIRLENDYLVTETGVELLSDFPLGL